jgi:hypothetical protein
MKVKDKLPLSEWLQGSKVIDHLGKYLVLYHGTNKLFEHFDDTQTPMVSGTLRGFYFTSDKSAAQDYGKNLMVVMVNLKNPFVGSPMDHYREVHGIQKPGFGASPEVFARNRAVTPQVVKDWLIEQGHDGVIIPSGSVYFDHDEVIAFNPDQIRIIQTITPEMALKASHAPTPSP